MKTIKALSFFSLMLISGFSFSAVEHCGTNLKPQQAPKWVNLGSRVVNMKADHDEIPVTFRDGAFTAVKLKISKAPIFLHNMNIIFGNGDNKNVKFEKHFAAGSETRVIDLPGNNRIIHKVNLNYKSAPTQKGKAVVTLWGRR